MRTLRAITIVTLLSAATWALAPLAVAAPVASRASSIAEGQVFEISPFSVTVEASREVQIVGLRLVNSLGEAAPMDAAPYAYRAQQFEVELPVLDPHGYRLYWRLRDRAGQEMVGSVGFVVRGCEETRKRLGLPPGA